MSSKKILRLKTPTKLRQIGRSPNAGLKVHPRFADLQTVIKKQNHENSEYLEKVLITEINKLYTELEASKKHLEAEKHNNEELKKWRVKLEDEIGEIEKEMHNWKEMYELERENHRQLRAFYEKREKQWQVIVLQHKSMLDEYFYKNYRSENKSEKNRHPLAPKMNPYGDNNIKIESQEQLEVLNYGQKKQIKKIKRKSKENIVKPQIVYYYADLKSLDDDDEMNGVDDAKALNKITARSYSKNPEADDLFDKIIRKTFYHLRQKSIQINQLKYNEQMLKLKHAKTSTRQRLPKTLKKLQFQFQNEKQLAFFCDYVEQIHEYDQKQLIGESVFEFIMERLQYVEALAKTSNSDLQILGPSSLIVLNNMLQDGVLDDPEIMEIGQLSRDNLDLLLSSVIKPGKVVPIRKVVSEVDQPEQIRYSESELQSLSKIINGGKILGHESLVNDDPPTVDATMR